SQVKGRPGARRERPTRTDTADVRQRERAALDIDRAIFVREDPRCHARRAAARRLPQRPQILESQRVARRDTQHTSIALEVIKRANAVDEREAIRAIQVATPTLDDRAAVVEDAIQGLNTGPCQGPLADVGQAAGAGDDTAAPGRGSRRSEGAVRTQLA